MKQIIFILIAGALTGLTPEIVAASPADRDIQLPRKISSYHLVSGGAVGRTDFRSLRFRIDGTNLPYIYLGDNGLRIYFSRGNKPDFEAAFRFLVLMSTGEMESVSEGKSFEFSEWCIKSNYRTMNGIVTKTILGSSLSDPEYRRRPNDECVSGTVPR